jgi:tRNA dimethylallyltransferase
VDAPIIVVTGVTATGKTDLAMALADRFPAQLISVDSAMIYRGMDIGTAKPSAAELARHPHALIDIRDPAEPYSVAEFVHDADAAVERALASGKVPVLVGGTMMYLRAFREGLDAVPTSTPEVRALVAAQAQARGWLAMHAELVRIDPVAAEQIHPNNPQRLARALEVHALTGRPISGFWGHRRAAAARHQRRVVQVWLDAADRSTVHARIAARLSRMFESGLVEEVRALRSRGDLHADLPALRAVGYRQVWAHLEGHIDAGQMQHDTLVATRGLARRQYTWLRAWDDLARVDAVDVPQAADSVMRLAFG